MQLGGSEMINSPNGWFVFALRRSPLFPFPSHLAKFPFPSHLATFPSRGCARLELEKAATENRQM